MATASAVSFSARSFIWLAPCADDWHHATVPSVLTINIIAVEK